MTPFIVGLDLLWLGVVMKDFYHMRLAHLLSTEVLWEAAVVFYLLYAVGIFVFVVLPSIEKHSLLHAVLFGAFFGIIAYGTYDLTNMSTLEAWPLSVTILDMLWGAFLTGAVSGVGYFLLTFFAHL